MQKSLEAPLEHASAARTPQQLFVVPSVAAQPASSEWPSLEPTARPVGHDQVTPALCPHWTCCLLRSPSPPSISYRATSSPNDTVSVRRPTLHERLAVQMGAAAHPTSDRPSEITACRAKVLLAAGWTQWRRALLSPHCLPARLWIAPGPTMTSTHCSRAEKLADANPSPVFPSS